MLFSGTSRTHSAEKPNSSESFAKAICSSMSATILPELSRGSVKPTESCPSEKSRRSIGAPPTELPLMSDILIWSPKSGRHEVDNEPCGGSHEIRTESEVHGAVSHGGG